RQLNFIILFIDAQPLNSTNDLISPSSLLNDTRTQQQLDSVDQGK
ncbi:MAG: hypothetical protein RL713_205, partial [Bacteroidota bacterium]